MRNRILYSLDSLRIGKFTISFYLPIPFLLRNDENHFVFILSYRPWRDNPLRFAECSRILASINSWPLLLYQSYTFIFHFMVYITNLHIQFSQYCSGSIHIPGGSSALGMYPSIRTNWPRMNEAWYDEEFHNSQFPPKGPCYGLLLQCSFLEITRWKWMLVAVCMTKLFLMLAIKLPWMSDPLFFIRRPVHLLLVLLYYCLLTSVITVGRTSSGHDIP